MDQSVNYDERFIFLVGFTPEAGVLDFPEVNDQLARLEEPNTVLFDESSRSEFGPIGGSVSARTAK